jgi:dCMP deaminase
MQTSHADRKSWEEYFMDIALNVAQRSTCTRASVGAVIVRDRNILATGYNGSPSGMPHCHDEGCLIYTSTDPDGNTEENCFRTIHAEINAIAQAARNGTAIQGADIYITHSPCLQCLKVLLNINIRRIYYRKPYKIELIKKYLGDNPVELIEIKESE